MWQTEHDTRGCGRQDMTPEGVPDRTWHPRVCQTEYDSQGRARQNMTAKGEPDNIHKAKVNLKVQLDCQCVLQHWYHVGWETCCFYCFLLLRVNTYSHSFHLGQIDLTLGRRVYLAPTRLYTFLTWVFYKISWGQRSNKKQSPVHLCNKDIWVRCWLLRQLMCVWRECRPSYLVTEPIRP